MSIKNIEPQLMRRMDMALDAYNRKVISLERLKYLMAIFLDELENGCRPRPPPETSCSVVSNESTKRDAP